MRIRSRKRFGIIWLAIENIYNTTQSDRISLCVDGFQELHLVLIIVPYIYQDYSYIIHP